MKRISQSIKSILSVICLIGFSIFGIAQEAIFKERNNSEVFKKLHKGVNADISIPTRGVWPKIQYEVGLFKSVKEAGFESVRIFEKGLESKDQIEEALANDLAIVICLWGNNKWAKDIELGKKELVSRWQIMAEAWKDYPNDLVFEILNEPSGIGFDKKSQEDHLKAMSLYNLAVQTIRDIDPDRPILISMGGHNDSEFLDPYVNEKYLTYNFDGKSFYDDPNIGVAIHFYNPKQVDGINFAFYTESLGDDEEKWKSPITEQIMYAVDWRAKIGVDIPIITTEWGCWLFPERTKEELGKWIDHHMYLFKKHNIGNMWYTGIQNNQRTFGLLNSEFGWNQFALDKLTGAKPRSFPKINQVVNGEFFKFGFAWKLSSEKIIKENEFGNKAFSGNSMAKITVPENEEGQFYLQTYKGKKGYKGVEGRSLLHLKQGETYKISFIGAVENGSGKLKIILNDVIDSRTIYDSSHNEGKWIELNDNPTIHEVVYTHNSETVMDVRLAFDFGGNEQVVYLDKVVFVRE